MKFKNHFKFTKFISISSRTSEVVRLINQQMQLLSYLRNNKKIAVTANSHKVIHNLLERVENLANNQKYVFKGLKDG